MSLLAWFIAMFIGVFIVRGAIALIAGIIAALLDARQSKRNRSI